MAARVTGASSDQVMFALTLIAAVVSSLALYWMLQCVINDPREAALGMLIVLTLGTLHLVINYFWTGVVSVNNLAFLRRYVPSAAFPFLFIFCGAVLRAVRLADWRRKLFWIGLAGLSFTVLVYSYFFLWTAALAWFCCFSIILVLVTKEERIGAIGTLGGAGVLMALSLSPYFILISQRVHSTDQALALELTRRPDLFRLTEVLGFVALLGLVYVVRHKNHGVTNETLVFTAALALTPFVVFNQQLIHGRSLQPFHYGLFVVNYVAIAALFITLVLVCRTLSSREQKIWRVAIYALTFLAVLSGAYQALLAGRRYAAANFLRDSALPAMRQLAVMGRSAQGQSLDTNSLVLCTDVTVADTLPTVAPQPIMWAPHM